MPKILIKLKNKIVSNIYFPIAFCFVYIVILSFLNINIMYSAFLAGLILKRSFKNANIEIMNNLKNVSLSFFIPLYFALVGLRVDLINNFNIIRFIQFFTIASVLEIGGIILILNILKVRKEAIINFSVAMSARGGPGIVLAMVGYEAGIINIEFFTVLILTSILSSLFAGAWLRFQTKKGKEIFSKVYKND
jgi:Kef-type K+ transport system membrane component KefB